MAIKRYLPACTIVASIVGAVLRGLNLYTGYEPVSGLPIAGNVYGTALVIVSVVVALFFLLASRQYRTQRGASFEDAFTCEHGLYRLVTVLAGFLLGGAGVWGIFRIATGQIATVDALGKALPVTAFLPMVPLWALAIFAMLAFFVLCKMQAGGTISEGRAAFSIVPMFWACFELIITFKDNGASPFVSLYAFELFAAIFLVFAFYSYAGFFYAKSNPARFTWTASLGVFFSFTCVGGYLVCGLLGGSAVTLSAESTLRYFCFAGASIYLMANLFISGKRLSAQCRAPQAQ